ncbi:MAG TPA: SDR family oxidoreductase [Steroidobacteraceae bacterium]|nr:SDR family oxidoreductase [Steroidobacteraceae bacterium]
MRIDLSDTNVLVTGASRGIGAAIARAMGGAGARVAIHYRDQRQAAAALAKEIGAAEIFQADLSSAKECAELWTSVLERFGRVHALINNAGISLSSPMESPTGDWLQAWDTTLAVNLRAPALLCKLAIEHFGSQGGGRIINISSRAAFRGDQPPYLAYAASKGGLVALTRSIARAYGKAGILAFNVAPGFTRTDMAKQFIGQFGEDYASSDIALRRLTEPEDIAPFVVFLASGLGDHATGCTIDINAASYVH